jgi:hypothetical protein
MSIHHDKIPHNRNMAMNPDRNALPGLWATSSATRNAAIAMIHQSNQSPPRNASSDVSNIAMINFIMLIKRIICSFKLDLPLFFSGYLIK